jgi:hypothetical protein
MASYSISPVSAPWASGGLGTLASGSQVAMSTVSSAGTILTGTAPAWMAAATAAWAVPVIGAAVAGITLALMAIFSRKGPKQKLATTEIANQVEKIMQDNVAAYLAGPRTLSSQAQALANFDAAWEYLAGPEGCGSPEMGDPGLRCIFERQPVGTCTQAQADAAHEALSDCGKYPFFNARDPIANDPNVVPDPTLMSETGDLIDSITGGLFTDPSAGAAGGGMGWLLLAGAAVVVALSIGGNGK